MFAPRRALLGLTLGALALTSLGASAQEAADETTVLPMATGAVSGAYFPVGVSLCRVVNADRADHGLRCAAVPSQGSVENIGLLRAGDADLAIVQSDVQDAALNGTGSFAEAGAFEGLRAVMALYAEPLALVAAADAGIASLEDLPGKRVSLGEDGSGQRPLIADLMQEMGWRETALDAVTDLSPSAAATALCEGRIDAFFYAVGHPALAVGEAVSACGATLVPVQGPAVDAVTVGSPFYFAAEIPAGAYVGVDAPVPTFGVGATLVTRADVPEDQIRTVTAGILGALPDLAGFNPLLNGLDPAAMRLQALSAPLHPGAAAAFEAAAQ